MPNPYINTQSLSSLVQSASQIQNDSLNSVGQGIAAVIQSKEKQNQIDRYQASSDYLLQISPQVDDDFLNATREHASNPEGFNSAWDAYSEKQISLAPNNETKQRLKEELISYKIKGNRQATKEFTSTNDVKSKVDLFKFNNTQTSLIHQAYRDGNDSKVSQLMQELQQSNLQRGKSELEVLKLSEGIEGVGFTQSVIGATERISDLGGIEGLQQLRNDYAESKGIKDPNIRDQAVGIIDRQINVLKREEAKQERLYKAEITAQNEIVKRRIGANVDLMSVGYEPQQAEVESLVSYAITNDLTKQQNDLSLAERAFDFAQLSPIQRQNAVDKVVNPELKGYLLKTNKQLRQLERDNPLEHLGRQNVITLQDINIADPSSWQARAGEVQAASDHLGRDIGMLTKEERDVFNQQWQETTAREKLQLIGLMGQGLGDQLPHTLNDLVQDGNSQVAMLAQLVIEGAPQIAEQVLLGQDVIANDKSILPKQADMKMQLDVMMGNAYQGSPTQRTAIKDAAMAVYASESHKRSDYSGILSSERLEKAVQQVTGGLIEYETGGFFGIGSENSKLEPPVRGMTSDTFTEWVSSITPESISQMASFQKAQPAYPPEQIVTWLKEGAQLQSIRVAKSPNPVYIIVTSLGVVTDESGVKPFYLNYQE